MKKIKRVQFILMVINHFEKQGPYKDGFAWTIEDSFIYISEELDVADMNAEDYYTLMTECKDYYGRFIDLDS